MTIPNIGLLTPSSVALPDYEGWEKSVHDLSEHECIALKTALAANRPLLVRGEPGTGKTQLARAAAVRLKRYFVSKTLDAHTEVGELFWAVDAVRRLSEAQVLAAHMSAFRWLEEEASEENELFDISERIAEHRFLEPGVLWWAFDWRGANEIRELAGRDARPTPSWAKAKKPPGTVLLLDEIDKADPVLPNALLQALGMGRFDGPQGFRNVSRLSPYPLIIITSNQERDMPYAFMRRCVVLNLRLPTEREELIGLLARRGVQHAQTWDVPPPTDELLRRAAELLADERRSAMEAVRPGQAEYLDLIRAVCHLTKKEDERMSQLDILRPYVLEKYSAHL